MNKAQKEVIEQSLFDEKTQLRMLERIYQKASEDCAAKIRELSERKDMENLQSIIYQKQYQEILKMQIDETLADLQTGSYKSISDYLEQCYENGFVGAMYDIHYQGIPLVIPIDQKDVIAAINVDSKLSKGLYDRLGEDTDYLKKSIRAELSRGIVTGSTWNEIAEHIASGMNSPFRKAKNNAMRIARTEGHRIQQKSHMDACYKAKSKGANIVKQWDASVDGRTRDSHRAVDGEIRELDEKFSNNLMYPGDKNGPAEEVCNCRCCLLQRATWSLNEDELDTLKERADYFGLDKSKDLNDFKRKYLKAVETESKIDVNIGGLTSYPKKHQKAVIDLLSKSDVSCQKAWNDVCSDFHSITGVEYKSKTGRQAKGAFYSPYCDAVYLNISKESKGSTYETPYQVVFHEYGHHMDYIFNRKYGNGDSKKAFTETYKNGIFGKTIKDEANKAIERFAIKNNLYISVDEANIRDTAAKMVKRSLMTPEAAEKYIERNLKAKEIDREAAERQFCKYIKDNYSLLARSDISDMFEPVMTTTDHPFSTGHGADYWRNRDNGKEGFAEMYSAAINNQESWGMIQQYFPESVKIFKEILEVVE